MPIYEYACPKCGEFEVTQRITEEPLKKCPTCKSKVRKLISSTSFQLKGSGWYVTDYAKKGAAKDDEPRTGGTSASGEGDEPKSSRRVEGEVRARRSRTDKRRSETEVRGRPRPRRRRSPPRPAGDGRLHARCGTRVRLALAKTAADRRADRSWSASTPAARSPTSSASSAAAARPQASLDARRPGARGARRAARAARRGRDARASRSPTARRSRPTRCSSAGRARRPAHHRRLRGRARDRPPDASRPLRARAATPPPLVPRAARLGVAERLTLRRPRAAAADRGGACAAPSRAAPRPAAVDRGLPPARLREPGARAPAGPCAAPSRPAGLAVARAGRASTASTSAPARR